VGLPALVLVWLAATPPWRAPGHHPIEGDTADRLRIFVELEAAHWAGSIVAAPDQGAFKLRNHSVGVFGYKRAALGFGLGWGIGEWIVVGARGEFAVYPDRDTMGNAGLVRGGSFQPYVELLFARSRHVRPFALARAGIGGAAAFRHKGGEWQGQVSRTIVPSVGVGLGTHAFVSEDLSFDVAVTFDYRWHLRARPGAQVETVGRWRVTDTSMIAGLVLGFSRWF
jgi:hypothetical protein